MLARAIAEYHELLTLELESASQAHLDAQLRARGLQVGAQPLCSVIRPRLLPIDQYRELQRGGALILRALGKLAHAALATPELRAQLGLADWEEQLLAADPGYDGFSLTGRLDGYFTDGGRSLRFTGYDAEAPSGAVFGDALAELFYGLPCMRAFLRRWELWPLPVRPALARTLLAAFEQWAGHGTAPLAAIVDWSDSPAQPELALFQRYLAEQGVTSAVADPAELEYAGGRLVVAGRPVDLVYRRVRLSDLVARDGADGALLRAVRERAVCMVNPPRASLLARRASLAALGDERNAELFSGEEREAIRAHIPWTRRVSERFTSYRGRRVDLVPFILQHRDDLVLEPDERRGGGTTVRGWEVDASVWEAAAQQALEHPWVAQQRLLLPREPFASAAGGEPRRSDRVVATGAFTFHDAFVEGALTRLHPEALPDGGLEPGSLVPTFLLAGPRE